MLANAIGLGAALLFSLTVGLLAHTFFDVSWLIVGLGAVGVMGVSWSIWEANPEFSSKDCVSGILLTAVFAALSLTIDWFLTKVTFGELQVSLLTMAICPGLTLVAASSWTRIRFIETRS